MILNTLIKYTIIRLEPSVSQHFCRLKRKKVPPCRSGTQNSLPTPTQMTLVDTTVSTAKERKKERKLSQSCPTLCDPVDCSPPGSSVHGILQARILEWVAISFSRDLPDPGIEPRSPSLQTDALTSEPPEKPINSQV